MASDYIVTARRIVGGVTDVSILFQPDRNSVVGPYQGAIAYIYEGGLHPLVPGLGLGNDGGPGWTEIVLQRAFINEYIQLATGGGPIQFSVAAGSPGYIFEYPANPPAAGETMVSNGDGTFNWVDNESGVIAVGTLDGQTPNANGGVVSAQNLYFQSASETVPGLVNNTSQNFSGAKTFYLSATDKFVIDMAANGVEASLLKDYNGALTYLVWNSNAGASARSIISFGNDTGDNVFSIGSHSTNHSFFPNSAVWAAHFANGSHFSNTQPGAPHEFWQNGVKTFELNSSSAARFWGAGVTNNLTINPVGGTIFNYQTNYTGQTTSIFQNNNSGAGSYSEVDVSGNAGSLLLGHSSSGVTGTWIEGDQAYVLSQNTRGLMVGTLASDVKFVVGGTTSAFEWMRIAATGVITMQADANNKVTVNPATQSGIKLTGNDNARNVLIEVEATSGGSNEFSGYIFSTSAGSHVAGISVSGPNVTTGASYPPNMMRYTSSLANGKRFLLADGSNGVKFDVWTVSANNTASRLSINEAGTVVMSGNGAATNPLTFTPSGGYAITHVSTGSGYGTNFSNSNSGAYGLHLLQNNLGSFVAMQQSGSAAAFSIASADQGQVISTGAGGLLHWAQAGAMQFGTGSGGGAGVRMSISLAGIINMVLPTYADNTAATGGGLTVGDVYQTATGELRIVV